MQASKEKFFDILSSGREDNKWDFKQDIHLKPMEEFAELLKDIMAFSNSGGGHLLLGVQDKTNDLIGVSKPLDEADLGQKINTALGYSIDFEMCFFIYDLEDNKKIDLGIIYIPNSDKICVSSKDFTSTKKSIIQADVVYVRRNTRSIKANSDDLHELAYKIVRKGQYALKDKDLEIVERNKSISTVSENLSEYLRGEFRFSSIQFSNKLNQIYKNQSDYNKLEFAVLLGLDENNIDAYFDGLAVPKLEHILRAVKIFNLPVDFFFQPTLNMKKPLKLNPLITYCIIDKVTDKNNLFKINHGVLIEGVFYKLAISLRRFINWLNSERMVKPEDEMELLFSNYDDIYDYVISLSDDKLSAYKDFLRKQYYKLIEVVGNRYKPVKGLFSEEEIIFSILGSRDEKICRIINESIKEIKIGFSGDYYVEFHYFYEIENLLVRSRSYNHRELKLEFSSSNVVNSDSL